MSSIDSAGPYDPNPSECAAPNFLGQICRYKVNDQIRISNLEIGVGGVLDAIQIAHRPGKSMD